MVQRLYYIQSASTSHQLALIHRYLQENRVRIGTPDRRTKPHSKLPIDNANPTLLLPTARQNMVPFDYFLLVYNIGTSRVHNSSYVKYPSRSGYARKALRCRINSIIIIASSSRSVAFEIVVKRKGLCVRLRPMNLRGTRDGSNGPRLFRLLHDGFFRV